MEIWLFEIHCIKSRKSLLQPPTLSRRPRVKPLWLWQHHGDGFTLDLLMLWPLHYLLPGASLHVEDLLKTKHELLTCSSSRWSHLIRDWRTSRLLVFVLLSLLLLCTSSLASISLSLFRRSRTLISWMVSRLTDDWATATCTEFPTFSYSTML